MMLFSQIIINDVLSVLSVVSGVRIFVS